MSRYFFHIHDGGSVIDDFGLELPDLEDARIAAVALSSEILSDETVGPFWDGHCYRVEVTDSPRLGGRTFFVLQFSVTKNRRKKGKVRRLQNCATAFPTVPPRARQ
jgi:hypothetical protein